MISTQTRSARRGFSLIEVAIALVIFVIGALAIVRIFPGALSVIGNNGNQQIAMNLNREVSARLKTDGAVPGQTFNLAVKNDGTLSWTTSDNTNHTADYIAVTTAATATDIGKGGDIAASVLGIPRFNATLPTTEDINTQANNSALSRFRGIIGEQAKVLKIGNDYYAATQFPISIQETGGTQTPLAPTISQEYTVQNARIDGQGKVTFANATVITPDNKEYRLDDTSTEANTAGVSQRNTLSPNSMVYVSYRYHVAGGNVWSVKEEAVPVSTALTLTALTAQTTPIAVNPPATTRGAAVAYNSATPETTGTVAEAIDVRVKNYAGVGTFGTGAAVEQITNARCGLVKLPFAPTTSTVSVDYVADWSLLMQKATLLQTPEENRPERAGYFYREVSLGAPLIEDQAPVGVYSLLQDPNASQPLYLSQFGTSSATPDPTTGNSGLMTPTQDELRSGKLTFSLINPPSSGASEIEPKVRVAYRTRDNWVQQLSVAANAYKPFVANGAEPWRDYFLGDDNYLYFHAGEAGKTISISYITRKVVSVNGNDTIVDDPIVERPFVIDEQIIDTPTASPANVPANFATSGKVSRVKLTNANGGDLPNNATLPTTSSQSPNLLSIQGVKGNSVTLRTAYINGTKYAQTVLTSNRGTN